MKRRKVAVKDKVKEIIVSDHALQRWNARVGPPMNLTSLSGVMNRYLQDKTRIQTKNVANVTVAYFDEDIVAIIDLDGDQMIIKTFYGRMSMNDVLADFTQLMRFLTRQRDRACLLQPESKISKAKIPKFPIGTTTFKIECLEFKMNYWPDGIYEVIHTYGTGSPNSMEMTKDNFHHVFQLSKSSISHYHRSRLILAMQSFIKEQELSNFAK